MNSLSVASLLLLSSCAAVRLMALPVFEDEGSQLHLIQRIVSAGEWLQPLGDGKPLESWLMVPLAWLDPRPLMMIRGVHVLAGMIGAVLTYRLALYVLERRAAFVSGMLFALCPFVVYLQRLALSDILLCTAGLWALLRFAAFVKSPTAAQAAWLAAALVLVAFCKLPVGFIYLLAAPLALVSAPRVDRESLLHPPVLHKLIAAHLPAVALALGIVLLALVRVRSGHDPGFGLRDFLGVGLGQYHDIATTIGIARPDLLTELTAQLSWPVLVLAVIGLVAAALRAGWQRWFLAMGAIPLLGIGLLASFWYSRYLLFSLPPLIIAAVAGWESLSHSLGRPGGVSKWVALAVCTLLMGRQSALLILDPPAARWSALDRFQYFEGWGSGYGYPQAARFIVGAPVAPQRIYSLDSHSTYQLRNYLPPQWAGRVSPIAFGEDGKALRSEAERLHSLLSSTPAWIIVPAPLLQRYLAALLGSGNLARLELRDIAGFDKPGSRMQLAIYEVTARK